MSVIVYYGVSGHCKGLVDAISGFRVKSQLGRAVTTSNFCYGNSLDIYSYLKHFPRMITNIILFLILKQLLKKEKIHSYYQSNYAYDLFLYLMVLCKQKLILVHARNV